MSYSEGRKLHKDVDNLLFVGEGCDAVDILIGKKRIAFPAAVVEAQADIIAQCNVAKQQLQLGSQCAIVDIMGRFPAQYVLCALCQHALKAELCHLKANIVAVNQ